MSPLLLAVVCAYLCVAVLAAGMCRAAAPHSLEEREEEDEAQREWLRGRG